MKEILLGISVLTWFGFLLHSWYRVGVQNTISALYYKLPTKEVKQKLLFFFVYLFSALPLVVYAMTLDLPETGIDIKILMFFGGVCFAGVGVAPDYYKKYVERVHIAMAIGAIVLGMLFLIAVGILTGSFIYYILVGGYILFVKGLPYLVKIKNFTTWIELLAYVVLVIGLWIT